MISSLSFFLTDIFYKKDNSSKLTIFGRKKNNEKVILEAEFSPYFWIEFIGSKNKIKEKLSKICIADFHEREVNGQKKELIKAQFKSPEQLVEIKKEIITWPEVKELYEYDIPFKNRFLIDNKLKQFKLCNAKVDGTKLISINSEQETYSPKILAYDIEVESSLAFPTPEKDKILFISFYGTDDFKKVITWKKFKTNLNYIEFVSSVT